MKHISFTLVSLFLFGLASYSQTTNHWESIVYASDVWKYSVPTSEPSANWTNPDFDDSSWLSGPGGFGYGDNDDNTILPSATVSVFMRMSFTLTDASTLLTALLYIDYDDGFVAYLNGTEVARANLGTQGVRPAFNALAYNAIEPAAVSAGIPLRFTVDNSKLRSALRNGTNTLALQFHNQSSTSSDLSSTTYFFGGFSNSSSVYRVPPTWFIPPPEVTSHLPLIIIDTWGGPIQDEPKIDAWIKVINKGVGQINNINDPGNDFEGYIGIETRGQSSQMFPKKGYGFETRNQLKEDSAISLLGMPAESDWILSAPYSDKTMMRNQLTYYLGNRMGRWQPRTQWCELYLNGDYQGVYLLIEKIKRDKNRVDIDKLLPEEISGNEMTGGYIVKVDKLFGLTPAEYFRTYPTASYYTARNYDFTYVYPKAEDIVPEQKTYLKNFLTSLETTLNSTNFKDPVNGFRSVMDEISFAEFEIIQELTNSVDGYRYSTFFYKENISDGGKLFAGPIWDFDLAYGNVDYAPGNLATNQWLYVNYGNHEGYPMHWWNRLMEDPDYLALVKFRYTQLRSGPLKTDSVFAFLDNNHALLGPAIERNYNRWPILDKYIWPNAYIGYTFPNEMNYLKTWISNRLKWMDSQWLIPVGKSDENIKGGDVTIFPNPFYDRITIAASASGFDDISVEFYDTRGQKMLSRVYKTDNSPNIEIVVEDINLQSGIYFVQVTQSGKIINRSKLVCFK